MRYVIGNRLGTRKCEENPKHFDRVKVDVKMSIMNYCGISFIKTSWFKLFLENSPKHCAIKTFYE